MSDPVVVLTGGAGFIGTHLTLQLLVSPATKVFNLDKLTYAADPDFHRDLDVRHPRYRLIEIDIADLDTVEEVIRGTSPNLVLNLAAESHVDRSIDAASPFVRTNYLGTHSLLEACLRYWKSCDEADRRRFRFVQVSTDEVFGDIPHPAMARPDSVMRPSSPYAATKAGADLLAQAFFRTHGLPIVVTHSSNNYGPRQHPEKLIPVAVATALSGLPIPLYGDGRQVRDWIHVDDHVRGLMAVSSNGLPGRSYCLAGGNSHSNLEIVERICSSLDTLIPRPGGDSYADLIEHVRDRPGHDVRYAIDDSASRRELEWCPTTDFASGFHRTVEWFVTNRNWWASATGFSYERLGHGN